MEWLQEKSQNTMDMQLLSNKFNDKSNFDHIKKQTYFNKENVIVLVCINIKWIKLRFFHHIEGHESAMLNPVNKTN